MGVNDRGNDYTKGAYDSREGERRYDNRLGFLLNEGKKRGRDGGVLCGDRWGCSMYFYVESYRLLPENEPRPLPCCIKYTHIYFRKCVIFSLTLSSKPVHPSRPNFRNSSAPRSFGTFIRSLGQSFRSSGNVLSGSNLLSTARISFQLYGSANPKIRSFSTSGSSSAATCRRAMSLTLTIHCGGICVNWAGKVLPEL